MDLEKLNGEIDTFVEERQWEQYHTPKNLVMALSGEVGELNECFQWLNDDAIEAVKKSADKLIPIEHEIADIFIYLVRLANKMGINIEEAIYKKMALNKLKYPVESNQGVVNKT